MKRIVLLVSGLNLFYTPVSAQVIERDSFEVGVQAFSAGNCKEALRIMKKYEKEQPSAAHVVKVCELLENKNEKRISYDALLQEIRKGNLSALDKLALVDRFSGEIKGFTGAMHVRTLIANAERGHTEAAFQTGLLYQEGKGTKKDFSLAAKYFQKAADAGHTEALNILGVYYRFGIGVEKNEQYAENLFKKAVLKNNIHAFYNLGRLYADRKDFLQAQLLASPAVKKINPKNEKKKYARMNDLLKESEKSASLLQKAYLEKFRPFWLKPLLSEEEAKRFTVSEEFPLPPASMVEETDFMKFIRKDDFDNRYKTFFPLMPDWIGITGEAGKNPALSEKNKPAPSPREEQTIHALYFRPADPRFIHLTLENETDTVPVMVGDILTLTVYTPLHETETTRKGGHMYIKNTAYQLNTNDPADILTADGSFVLTPLSEQTRREESWLSQRFLVRKEGTAVIRFVPQTGQDGKTAFPYSLKIVALKGKSPK